MNLSFQHLRNTNNVREEMFRPSELTPACNVQELDAQMRNVKGTLR